MERAAAVVVWGCHPIAVLVLVVVVVLVEVEPREPTSLLRMTTSTLLRWTQLT